MRSGVEFPMWHITSIPQMFPIFTFSYRLLGQSTYPAQMHILSPLRWLLGKGTFSEKLDDLNLVPEILIVEGED